jgi:hypothetical protein
LAASSIIDNYEHSFADTTFQSYGDSDQLKVTMTHPKEPRDQNTPSGDAVALNVHDTALTNSKQIPISQWIFIG